MEKLTNANLCFDQSKPKLRKSFVCTAGLLYGNCVTERQNTHTHTKKNHQPGQSFISCSFFPSCPKL